MSDLRDAGSAFPRGGVRVLIARISRSVRNKALARRRPVVVPGFLVRLPMQWPVTARIPEPVQLRLCICDELSVPWRRLVLLVQGERRREVREHASGADSAETKTLAGVAPDR